MTMITRWDPFRELSTLQDRMNRLFQDSFGSQGNRSEESLVSGAFVPPVDVYEDEHSVVIKLEAPGIDQKDIDIRVENHVLTIRGERKLEKTEKQENFQRVERQYGSFSRSFTLPDSLDTDNVSAEYENGLLKIAMAKRAEAKPKQIKVNIGQKALEGKGTAA